MELLLLAMRHLVTQDNLEERFSSGDRDVPLLPNQRLPRDIMNHLKKLEVGELTIVHTGLRRTIQTAQLLMRSLRYPRKALVIPQFRERIGGGFAGLTFSELQRVFPELGSPNQFWTIEVPDRGLESSATFLSRIEGGIAHLTSLPDVSTVVIIAHAGSIKGIKAVLTANEVGERKQILCEATPHRGLFQFSIERRQPWQEQKLW